MVFGLLTSSIIKRNYYGLWFIDIYDSKKKLLWSLVLNQIVLTSMFQQSNVKKKLLWSLVY